MGAALEIFFFYKRCSISANLIILISLCCRGWNAGSAQYYTSFLFHDAEKIAFS